MTDFRTRRRQVAWLRQQGCRDLRNESEINEIVIEWQSDQGCGAPHGLDIVCECGCGCGEPAILRDHDSGGKLCDACSQWATDDDGEVVCSRSGDVEEVVDGNHSYYRAAPPPMPAESPEGEYAL